MLPCRLSSSQLPSRNSEARVETVGVTNMVELGTRHECEECSTKFYDLGSSVICCPKCGWNPDEPRVEEAPGDEDSTEPRAKKVKKAASKKAASKKAGAKKAASKSKS